MNHKQKKLFQEEILRVLKKSPKKTQLIFRALNKKHPQYCDNSQNHFGTRPKWKHDTSILLHNMQKEFLIYLDKGTNLWKIVK